MNKQLLKDSAVYISGSVIVQGLGFIGLIFLMRYLSVEEYGKYTYIIEFISIFAFFSDGGFTQYIVKEASQNTDRIQKIYSDAQSSQMIISGIMISMILVTSYLLNTSVDFFYLAIYGLSVVLNAFFAPMLAVLVALGRKDLVFYKDVSLSVLRLTLTILGIIMQAPIIYFISLGFLNCIVLGALFYYTRLSNQYDYFFKVSTDFSESWSFIKQGTVFTMLMAANVIYNKIDIIMLEKMAGSIEVGYYAGATRLIYPFMFFSTAFMTAAFPILARNSKNKENFKRLQALAIYYLGGLGVTLSTVLFFLADLIFATIFDHKYDSSIPIFKVLVWFLAIVFIYGSISNSLVATNRIRFLVYLNIAMIFINITANLFMIPIYGALGSAIITVTCESLILIIIAIYWKWKVSTDK